MLGFFNGGPRENAEEIDFKWPILDSILPCHEILIFMCRSVLVHLAVSSSQKLCLVSMDTVNEKLSASEYMKPE